MRGNEAIYLGPWSCAIRRANPEDIKRASGFKVREVRGVRVDTFVRLKDETNPEVNLQDIKEC